MAILATFLRPVFSASRVQHVSDQRTKSTPCVEVWQTSNLRPLRLGEEKQKERRKKKKEKEERRRRNHRAKLMVCPIPQGDHN